MSSYITLESVPSDNYLELLQYRSEKAGLLLFTSIGTKSRKRVWIQPNMMSNLMKGLWLEQLVLILEELNLFETPAALIN